MADQHDIDFLYTTIDKLFRASLGEHADFSGARYDGDFSLTLDEAQRRKHEFILSQLNIAAGARVLDMGCGWGPMLQFFRRRGIQATGVTLSRAQAKYGRKSGLDVHLMDCRSITPATFGTFDAIVSLGAFEHFCSVEQYKAGKQDEVYREVFRVADSLLQPGRRFFLQTMVFGERMIPYEQIDINADHHSDAFMLARMEKMFPGSWLPGGTEQIVRTAAPIFKMLSAESGRNDYLETIKQWGERFRRPSSKKRLIYLTLLPHYFFDKNFRQAVKHGGSANSECFKRDLINHFRMVLEKV
jgi:cyclopropane-fatty-acyl-phospholipid synthase